LQKRLFDYAVEQGYLRPPVSDEPGAPASLEAYRQKKVRA